MIGLKVELQMKSKALADRETQLVDVEARTEEE